MNPNVTGHEAQLERNHSTVATQQRILPEGLASQAERHAVMEGLFGFKPSHLCLLYATANLLIDAVQEPSISFD